MTPQAAKRLFSVDEFHRMGEAGILGEDDRLELIDGEIIAMTPIGPGHAGCVNRLTALLAGRVGSRAVLAVQNPVFLGEHAEPQPDVVLLKPRPDFYSHSHPAAQDVLLVIEVADSSADYDRTVKVPHYARAGIPEVWIVDLPQRVVEVYRKPEDGEYREHLAVGSGADLRLPGLPGAQIAADDVLA